MMSQVILTDLKTDGAMPIDCEITVSYNTDSELLNFKFDKLDLEISVPVYDIGIALGNEEHG